MAKTAGKSKARVGAAGKAKRPTKDSKAPARMQARHADDEDHVDGCDFEFHDSEATPDSELPAAKGGVEISGGKGRRRLRQPM